MLIDAPGYEAPKETEGHPAGGKKPEKEKPLDADAIAEILKNINP